MGDEEPNAKRRKEQTVPHPASEQGLRGLQVAHPVPAQPTIEVWIYNSLILANGCDIRSVHECTLGAISYDPILIHDLGVPGRWTIRREQLRSMGRHGYQCRL